MFTQITSKRKVSSYKNDFGSPLRNSANIIVIKKSKAPTPLGFRFFRKLQKCFTSPSRSLHTCILAYRMQVCIIIYVLPNVYIYSLVYKDVHSKLLCVLLDLLYKKSFYNNVYIVKAICYYMSPKQFKRLPTRPLHIKGNKKEVFVFFRKLCSQKKYPSGGKVYFIRLPKVLLETMGWKKGDTMNIALKIDWRNGERIVTLSRATREINESEVW